MTSPNARSNSVKENSGFTSTPIRRSSVKITVSNPPQFLFYRMSSSSIYRANFFL